MDSQVTIDPILLDIVDDAWREDTLPFDDIDVPFYELPDPESDNGDSLMTLKEQERKWTDLALGAFSEQQQAHKLSNYTAKRSPSSKFEGCIEDLKKVKEVATDRLVQWIEDGYGRNTANK